MKFPKYFEEKSNSVSDLVLDLLKRAYESGYRDGQNEVYERAQAIVTAQSLASETEDEKCNYYRPNGGYANSAQCLATKERDPCVCGGIRSKCDLHPALPMWKG